MVKRIISLLFCITVSISIGGCAGSSKQQELAITMNQTKIDAIKVQELPNDNKDIFKPVFEKNTVIEIKHIEIGEKVTLDFEKNSPDEMTIQEIFLNTNGETLYSDKEIKNISFTQEKNKYFFTIEKSIVSGLSSEQFKGKTEFRGYKITTLIGKDTKVYICVVRTDSE